MDAEEDLPSQPHFGPETQKPSEREVRAPNLLARMPYLKCTLIGS